MTTVDHRFASDFLAFERNSAPCGADDGKPRPPSGSSLAPEGKFTTVRPVSLAEGLEFAFVFAGHRPSSIDAVLLFGDDRASADGATDQPSGRTLVIEEISSSGTVPTLVARNPTKFDYLLLAGQIVRGGKQNRGINADILIRANSSAEIPVTCVEQGRWSRTAQSPFRHGGMEPLSVRSGKMREVHASRRSGTAVRANQQAVWNEIASMEQSLGAETVRHDVLASIEHSKLARGHRIAASRDMQPDGSTASPPEDCLSDLEHIEDRLQDLERELHDIVRLVRELPPHECERRAALRRRYSEVERDAARLRARRAMLLARPPVHRFDVTPEAIDAANAAAKGSSGMLVFFQGEFIAGDIFANPSWFETIYGDLRDSALLSWDVTAQRHVSAGRPFTRRSPHPVERTARSIVRDALAGDWSARPSIAHGTSLLLNHPFLEGSMIVGPRDVPLHILLGTVREPDLLAVRERSVGAHAVTSGPVRRPYTPRAWQTDPRHVTHDGTHDGTHEVTDD